MSKTVRITPEAEKALIKLMKQSKKIVSQTEIASEAIIALSKQRRNTDGKSKS